MVHPPDIFILPFIFFAYKRSWKGLVVTIIALFTSMFWFPAPATVAEGGESGWAVLVPAVIGMLVCDAAVYFGVKFVNRGKTSLGETT